jgi:hypothetical protein
MAITGKIIDLIEADLGVHVRKSGKWLFWHCPFHSDKTPSLGANTADNHWFCFSCRRGGGEGAWIKQHRNGKQTPGVWSSPMHLSQAAPLPEYNQPPNEIWQIRALTWMAEWQNVLWTMRGKPGRWHLYARGLKGRVIEPYQLGYNPYDRYEKLEDWGLEPCSPEDRYVFLPAGVCIPWMVGDLVWKLNMRRFEKKPKYHQVKGSHPGLFGAGTLRDHDIAVVVEGECDALLLEQEAGDLVGVCTLGSASSRTLDGCWLSYLIHCQKIILVGDNDPAGQDWVRSMGNLSRRMCWTKVPAGKDITEFWRKGGDLKGWIEALLHQIRGECEREV